MAESAAPSPGRIFISYRREETAYPAAWLYDRLANRYGGQVFKDVDSIELGDDFVEVITRAVGSCDVLLALVGDQWLTIIDEDERRRLDDPDDFVRLEIEAALTRNVRVIPILVDGATMPRADELPPSLAGLVRRQALELSPARFDFDTSRLLKVLDRTLAELRTAHDVAASAPAGKARDASATQPPPTPSSGSDASSAQPDTVVEPHDDPEYTAALAAYFTQRWGTAVDLLTPVVARYPDFPQAADRLAEARRQQQLTGWDTEARQATEQGRWAAAIAALEHMAAAGPERSDVAQRLEHARTQLKITSLQADLRRMHAARQWTAVIALGQQLVALDSELADPDGLVTAARAELAEAAIADRYSAGLRQLDRDDRAAAAATFAAILEERPDYRDAAALLARTREDAPAQTAEAQEPPPQPEVPATPPPSETPTTDQATLDEQSQREAAEQAGPSEEQLLTDTGAAEADASTGIPAGKVEGVHAAEADHIGPGSASGGPGPAARRRRWAWGIAALVAVIAAALVVVPQISGPECTQASSGPATFPASFETGIQGWTPLESDTGCTSQASDFATDGSYSLRIDSTSTEGGFYGAEFAEPIDITGKSKVIVDIRTQEAETNTAIAVQFSDDETWTWCETPDWGVAEAETDLTVTLDLDSMDCDGPSDLTDLRAVWVWFNGEGSFRIDKVRPE